MALLRNHTWELYGITDLEKKSLEIWRIKAPAELADFNLRLFIGLRNRAIRMHYRRFRAMGRGPLKMKQIRGILAKLWCIGDESVLKILYGNKKGDVWIEGSGL